MYSKQITATIKNMVIFCKDVEKTAGFYSDAVGLKVSHQSKQFVELKDYSNFRIILKQVEGEAYNMKGYSPILNFEVDDFDHTLKKFLNYGAEKDGDIVENDNYQMGMFKSPNGEMISIIKMKNEVKSDDEGDGGIEDTKTSQEIKNILKKIQF